MRALVQCVSHAEVSIDDAVTAQIGRGFVVLLGVGADDTESEVEHLWTKIAKLRVFEDEQGKTNRSLSDIGGEVLVVSQFTLYANCKKGNRPSFTDAMEPGQARRLCELFIRRASADDFRVAHGEFGALMDVSLTNHGPFTIWLDTDRL